MKREENKLFPDLESGPDININNKSNTTERLARLDSDKDLRDKVLPYCRLKYGEIYKDKVIIPSGLKNIKEVITSGSAYLEDGMKVKVKN